MSPKNRGAKTLPAVRARVKYHLVNLQCDIEKYTYLYFNNIVCSIYIGIQIIWFLTQSISTGKM
jgi:hypothetical protein